METGARAVKGKVFLTAASGDVPRGLRDLFPAAAAGLDHGWMNPRASIPAMAGGRNWDLRHLRSLVLPSPCCRRAWEPQAYWHEPPSQALQHLV